MHAEKRGKTLDTVFAPAEHRAFWARGICLLWRFSKLGAPMQMPLVC